MEHFPILIVTRGYKLDTPRGYKFKLVSTLIFRSYSIRCIMGLFHIEIKQLKEIFEKNRYGKKSFDRCLRTIFCCVI